MDTMESTPYTGDIDAPCAKRKYKGLKRAGSEDVAAIAMDQDPERLKVDFL